MNENTLKMAAIRAGDYVTYLSESGYRLTREVEGWKTERGQRLLLLAGQVHITINRVIERQRPGGCCGAGTIVFEQEAS